MSGPVDDIFIMNKLCNAFLSAWLEKGVDKLCINFHPSSLNSMQNVFFYDEQYCFEDLGPITEFKMANNYKSRFVNGRIPHD